MSTKQRKFECSDCNNEWEEPFGTRVIEYESMHTKF